MKAVVYTRISTEYQEDGHSPEEQLRRCKQQAEFEGYEVVNHYHDTGSGSAFEHRPGYIEMMENAGTEWKIVIIYKLDRIHRNLRNMVLWLDDLRTKECDFVSTEERVDTTTAQGRFFIQVMGAFAEMEREVISSRVKMGLEGAKRSGRWIGVPPFGYKIDDTFTTQGARVSPGLLVPETREAEIVRKILENTAAGWGISKIITGLVINQHRTRSGSLVWNRSTVRNIIGRASLYIAGSISEPGKALQQPPLYGPNDNDVRMYDRRFDVVAPYFLEVADGDESVKDFEWKHLKSWSQLNDNSYVRSTESQATVGDEEE
nr:Site-specific recombinases, DNA invertase Pin homologs (PinR) [uncultured Mediterranean phage uvMED]